MCVRRGSSFYDLKADLRGQCDSRKEVKTKEDMSKYRCTYPGHLGEVCFTLQHATIPYIAKVHPRQTQKTFAISPVVPVVSQFIRSSSITPHTSTSDSYPPCSPRNRMCEHFRRQLAKQLRLVRLGQFLHL